jgi:hypothetical protein
VKYLALAGKIVYSIEIIDLSISFLSNEGPVFTFAAGSVRSHWGKTTASKQGQGAQGGGVPISRQK